MEHLGLILVRWRPSMGGTGATIAATTRAEAYDSSVSLLLALLVARISESPPLSILVLVLVLVLGDHSPPWYVINQK